MQELVFYLLYMFVKIWVFWSKSTFVLLILNEKNLQMISEKEVLNRERIGSLPGWLSTLAMCLVIWLIYQKMGICVWLWIISTSICFLRKTTSCFYKLSGLDFQFADLILGKGLDTFTPYGKDMCTFCTLINAT